MQQNVARAEIPIEDRMPRQPESWAVYEMTFHHKPKGLMAVCAQPVWDALELAHPGYHKLVRAHIATETEAELLARDLGGRRQEGPTAALALSRDGASGKTGNEAT